MADEQKTDVKKEETKAPTAEQSAKNDAARNALFILISLLVIVFLIGLALIINRGLNNENTINTTADNTGLINSDTNPPSNTTSNTTAPENNTTTPEPSPSPAPEPTPVPTTTPAPEPTPVATPSIGTGASTESPAAASGAVLPTGHTEDGYKKSLSTQTEINLAGYWIPTQYIAGDIPSSNGKYTVQYGDTLWFIAAGHYGDPFQWTTIEGANYSQIGFLPNGEHALIWPNQVLVLP